MAQSDLPSRRFEPRLYGVGAWTGHLHFAFDLVAVLKPALLVELGVDRGESYFAFCQTAAEHRTGTRCFGVDTWRGDEHAGGYDETTFAEVSEHNRAHYESFSTLLRCDFDEALARFADGSIDVLHLDGLHTETAVRHDLESWLPKLKAGGILLLHDVRVRSKDFGVWKIWAELQQQGRSWTFEDGPGLGLWQKPPAHPLPDFLEILLASPNDSNGALARYYTERAQAIHEKIAQQWRDGSIRNTPFAQQTVIQLFYSSDGSHREEDSVYARIGHEGWKDVRIELPGAAGTAPLRIDFVSALTVIEIVSIRVTKGAATCFIANEQSGFQTLRISGDAERLAGHTLNFRVTGVDPQLYLPVVNLPAGDQPAVLEIRLRVLQQSLEPKPQ
jgi:hypothetical protein